MTVISKSIEERQDELALMLKGCVYVYGDEVSESNMGVTEESTVLPHLISLHKFIKKIGRSGGDVFSNKDGAVTGKNITVKEFVQQVNKALAISDYIENRQFMPEIELFISEAVDKWDPLDYGIKNRDVSEVVKILNNFVSSVRDFLNSDRYLKLQKSYIRSSNKNYRSLVNFVDDIFKSYSRVLVVRVDLSYKKLRAKDYDSVISDRQRLIRNIRHKPKIFSKLVGYAIKLEYGKSKGFHFHCFFFFDGSLARQDITLASMIGEYWDEVITNGDGLYYNCNRDKSLYEKVGIGMIGHNEQEKRDSLLFALRYLTKLDKWIKVVVPKKIKLLTKSIVKPKANRGRPRDIQDSEQKAVFENNVGL